MTPMRILILEDHPDTRLVIERLLTRHGHGVKSFVSAEEILSHCEGGDEFDLLISDIGLPGENGLQALMNLRRKCKPFKAIAVTAFARPEELEQCRAAGFDGWLAKPILFPALLAEIERVCGQSV
jgi:CheY-like chemotaxis protein